MGEQLDLESVSTELYGLDPDAFTESRNARALQARKSGDRDLAARIRHLRKPSTAAWVLNQVARHHRETVGELLDLGAALRQAQHHLDGDRLRELGRERRQLTRTVVDQAQALAIAAGRDLGASFRAQVEQTVRAAIAETGAGTALADGRLTEVLTATGWPETDAATLLAAPPSSRPAAPKKSKPREGPKRADRQREKAEARAEAREAERAARSAQDDLRRATRRVSDLTQRRHELDDTCDELRRRLEKVEQQGAEADDDLRLAEERRDDAERQEQDAREAAAAAQQKARDMT